MTDFGVDALFALQLVLLVLLLRGYLRQQAVLFIYALISVVSIPLDLWIGSAYGTASPYYGYVYWLQEVIADFLLFLMVIVLISRTEGNAGFKLAAKRALVICVVVAVALPLLFGYRPVVTVANQIVFNGRWFGISSQTLNFGAAVMNMMLWTALIASKRRDAQLFAVSAGLGVTVAGQAIFYGVRLLSRADWMREGARGLSLLAQIVSTIIWCWAFRRSAKQMRSA